MVKKFVIFCDSSPWEPSILLDGVCHAISKRKDMEIAAVVMLSHPCSLKMLYRLYRAKVNKALRLIWNGRENNKTPTPKNIYFLARKAGADIVVPGNNNVNDPKFVKKLKSKYQPNVLLTFYFPQKLSPELLDIFEQKINYHNGLLPNYRGIKASSWSVYNGDPVTGFSFHHMTENFDDGPVLIEGTIEISDKDNQFTILCRKTSSAANKFTELLQCIEDRNPGVSQQGNANYYSLNMFKNITSISDPSQFSRQELFRRIHAFGILKIKFGERWINTRIMRTIKNSISNQRGLCFQTSDNYTIRIHRIGSLPISLHKLLKWSNSNC